MMALTESQQSRQALRELLAVELAPREGRWAAVARIATACVITVTIAMVFQIPQPAYMAYIVFLISKDEPTATTTAALGGLVAATLAIILTLGLALVDTGEPALRLPAMALATFAAMFTARTFALGPISFLAGFVIVLLQSLVDDAPNLEALTRLILWMWVVAFVPVAVTLFVNFLFGASAAAMRNRLIRGILKELETQLVRQDYRKALPGWRARLAALLETVRENAETAQSLNPVTTFVVAALLDLLVILEALPAELPYAVREELARRVHECLTAIESRGHPEMTEPTSRTMQSADGSVEQSPAVVAFLSTLSRLYDAVNRPRALPEATEGRAPRRSFAPDAFSNPAYWQFALKTTIAVAVSYSIYTLLDWPGLRTSIVTCFFVALASLGETVHKLVLRLSGAIIGGLIAGLSIVFVLPHLTDIGQLCLLIGGVSVGAAWVATSSQLLSYAGMQLAFAFFLGILQGYAPATDLTVLRDRIVGILLGNIVITIVFSSFWPASARSGVRSALAEALRAIGAVIGGQANAEEARMRTVQALVRADYFRALSLFELRMLPHHSNIPAVSDIERLAGAAFVVTADSISPHAEPSSTATFVQWAESAADSISRNQPMPNSPTARVRSQPHSGADPRALSQKALEQLESEVQHVASATH
jgi:multidrug resistance protein MdtO